MDDLRHPLELRRVLFLFSDPLLGLVLSKKLELIDIYDLARSDA